MTEIEQNEQLTLQTTEEIIEGNLLLPWQIKPYWKRSPSPEKETRMGITGTRGLHGVSLEIFAKEKGFAFIWVKTKSWTRIPSPDPSSLPKVLKLTDKGGLKSSQWGLPHPLAHPETTSLKNKQHGERWLFLLMCLPRIPEGHSLVYTTSESQHALCVSCSVVSDSLWPHGL